jgi:NADH:ubiquinone reductase (H+-translocating)
VTARPRVVIVGSGFGGLNAVTRLASAPVDVTLIDRDNYHGFWPLLYEVATAALGAENIAHPIRSTCSRYSNVRVRLGTVSGVDLDTQQVEVDGDLKLPYDYLILAAGSSTSDFGIPGVAEHAYPLKTLQDAVRLRNHVLSTFEEADGIDASAGSAPAVGALTTVLVGGGPTGVEMAGALSELIAHSLSSDFHYMDVSAARVVLVEMTDHLLPGFSPASQRAALRTLERKGVDVRLGLSLARVTAEGVSFDDGTSMAARTVIWTAGVQANAVAGLIPGDKGRGGTVPVGTDLSLPGHPEVFVIGDLAATTGRDGQALPQVAQVAIQGGRHTAMNIRLRLAGQSTRPFRYRDKGIMATIGRRSAVAELPGGLHLRGTWGWLAWLGVHLVFLVGFRNRLLVLVNWAWNYFTWDRASRVILDDGARAPTGELRA